MDSLPTLDDRLAAEIDARRDALVALTQDLVRIPTVNPPGENYRDICDYLSGRLRGQGFHCTLVRAEGAPGDSERWPRWNVVARKEGKRTGETVHFNSHIDVVEAGRGWTTDPRTCTSIPKARFGLQLLAGDWCGGLRKAGRKFSTTIRGSRAVCGALPSRLTATTTCLLARTRS